MFANVEFVNAQKIAYMCVKTETAYQPFDRLVCVLVLLDAPKTMTLSVSSVKDIVGNMARDPQYWLAFSQTVGTSYQNAVTMLEEKSLSDEISGRGEAMSQGEIRTKATLYALGTGLMNAAVERSGGLQTLPEELQHGGDVWEMIVNSGVSEGKEETLQGILDRAMQKLMLGKDYKLMSFTDKNAVFSLPAAAEEFGTGAFVGGLLSGGQALTHGIMNPAKYAINADGDVESVQPLMERDIIDTAELWIQQINEAAGVDADTTTWDEDPYVSAFDENHIAKKREELLPHYQTAKIPDEKLVGYALNKEHPIGRHKADAFEKALGYTVDNKDILLSQVYRGLEKYRAVERAQTQYGRPFEVSMMVFGANGRCAKVKTAWIIDNGAEEPRLVSIYVDE